jgi:membrane complex biogenesis BtpA family protein
MNQLLEKAKNQKLIIGALHLPPFPGSGHPERRSIGEIIDYAVRNIDLAIGAGITAIYIQDLGDHPWGREIQPHTVAGMSVVGKAVRERFPDLILGVCLMSHGAREVIAVGQAVSAQFVRIKVYVGAMVKAEGVLEGCAEEAIRYRSSIHAEQIAILADVHDRTGTPLGEMSLLEAAQGAALFGRADGLILTGRSIQESLAMLNEVRNSSLDVPLYLGGGANKDNIHDVLENADGVIVSTAFKRKGGWSRDSLQEDWDREKITTFMKYVKTGEG